MINLKNYKSEVKGECFSFVDISKLNDITEVSAAKHFFADFIEMLNITAEDFVRLKNVLAIQDKDLYDFSVFNYKYGILIAKDGVSTIKYEKIGGKYVSRTILYDVYLIKNLYCSIALNKMAEQFVKEKYPKLFKGNFVTIEDRFSENIRNIDFSPNMNINDLSLLLGIDDLTIEDLTKIMSDENYINSKVWKTKVSFYYNYNEVQCFLSLEENSLFFKLKDLINKDWKAIEDADIWVNKNYEGMKQKDRDYFINSALVKEFKETFFQ